MSCVFAVPYFTDRLAVLWAANAAAPDLRPANFFGAFSTVDHYARGRGGCGDELMQPDRGCDRAVVLLIFALGGHADAMEMSRIAEVNPIQNVT